MPRIFRQQYTAPIPKGAEPVNAKDRRGRTVCGFGGRTARPSSPR
jgi:hypothetical protein